MINLPYLKSGGCIKTFQYVIHLKIDLRDLSMAKLTFIFSDPQFLANAEAHFTDP